MPAQSLLADDRVGAGSLFAITGLGLLALISHDSAVMLTGDHPSCSRAFRLAEVAAAGAAWVAGDEVLMNEWARLQGERPGGYSGPAGFLGGFGGWHHMAAESTLYASTCRRSWAGQLPWVHRGLL